MPVSKLDKRRSKSPQTVAAAILQEMDDPAPPAGYRLFGGLVQGPSGLVYGYNGRYWEPCHEATLNRIAWEGDTRLNGGTTKKSRGSEIVHYLKAASYRHDLAFVRTADHEIPVQNGVVDVHTKELRAHRREDFLDSVLPVRFDPNARADAFTQALEDWFAPSDTEGPDDRANALIDFFGYVALPHARFKKALFLYGESDSGKSVPLKLLRKFVGEEFSCALGVDEMDDPVARAVIKHKRLNVLTELSSDAMIRDGGFKVMVSTEEPLLLNPKYEAPHQYVPIAKHVIASNNFPQVNDRSKATFNRLLPIPFTRVFAEADQDEGLFGKLTTPDALSGLLNLAITGAKRLIERGGKFVTPAAGVILSRKMEEESNPFFAFADARLIRDATGYLRVGELTDEFNTWRKGKKIDTRAVGKLARGAGLPWGDIWNAHTGGNDKGIKGWRLRVQADGAPEPPEPSTDDT
ncbi:MAG: hypothetical protein GC202_02130 [Alphaproteobacteria bacterium]|nr:hypothetical protein [Alphaproteobacteria bacterium]